MYEKILKAVITMSQRVGKASGILLVAMVVMVCLEVTLRYAFNAPTIWAHDTSSYLMLVFALLAAAWVTVEEEHASVDIVVRRLPPRGKAIASLVSALPSFLFFIVLMWKGFDYFWGAFESGQLSRTAFHAPLWPVMVFIPLAGFVLFIIRFLFFIRTLTSFKKGAVSK